MKKLSLLSAISATALMATTFAPPALAQTPDDQAAFEHAMEAGDIGSLNAFLSAYPTSPHAPAAFSAISDLVGPAAAARVAPTAAAQAVAEEASVQTASIY